MTHSPETTYSKADFGSRQRVHSKSIRQWCSCALCRWRLAWLLCYASQQRLLPSCAISLKRWKSLKKSWRRFLWIRAIKSILPRHRFVTAACIRSAPCFWTGASPPQQCRSCRWQRCQRSKIMLCRKSSIPVRRSCWQKSKVAYVSWPCIQMHSKESHGSGLLISWKRWNIT